jgi:hypothetical protein
MPKILLREKLVRAELAAAKLGIHEVGANNHGPWVKKFLAETGLPEGYAWCDAFQSYEEHGVAGHKLPIESASVGQTYATAKRLGWVVTRPRRGDLVLYNWEGAGPPFADHIGLVVKVLSLGATLKLRTVEGNTSSGVAGSQSDGDGVWLRTRVISAKQVAFVRIPGTVTVPTLVEPKPHTAATPPTIRRGAGGPPVGKLQTLLNRHGAHLRNDHQFGASTEQAVKAFQQKHHLAATGVVDAKTWHALEAK